MQLRFADNVPQRHLKAETNMQRQHRSQEYNIGYSLYNSPTAGLARFSTQGSVSPISFPSPANVATGTFNAHTNISPM